VLRCTYIASFAMNSQMPRGNLLSPSYPKQEGMILQNVSKLLPDHITSHNSKGHSTCVSIIYPTFILYKLGFHVVLLLRLVIYQQHKGKRQRRYSSSLSYSRLPAALKPVHTEGKVPSFPEPVWAFYRREDLFSLQTFKVQIIQPEAQSLY
jgi:hypothetical protein